MSLAPIPGSARRTCSTSSTGTSAPLLDRASIDARWEELKRAATAAKSYGFDLELVGPSEVKQRFPLVDLQGVRGAAWIASDGYVDPYSLTMAYAKGARGGGVRIVEGVAV